MLNVLLYTVMESATMTMIKANDDRIEVMMDYFIVIQPQDA